MDRKAVVTFAAATVILAAAALLQRRKRRKRSVWVKSRVQKREKGCGMLSMVDNELRLEDPASYRNMMRMSEDNFEELLSLVINDIRKEDTSMRCAISPRERLGLTLRFLATGEMFRSLMYSTKIHETTIGKIVPEVCKAIYSRLRPLYLRCPQTETEWRSISAKFEELWDYPMCIGAIEGKHIVFRAPKSEDSYNFNYKGTHSIVLLAVVDAEYKFLYVDFCVNGLVSDGGVWTHCSLYKKIDKLKIPSYGTLSTGLNVPFHFIADDAFALSQQLMKPYPSRYLSETKVNFNYRLSRARKVAENAFGILANRFRVLLSATNLSPEKVEDIVLATVALHNFLAMKNKHRYTDMSGDKLFPVPSLSADIAQRSNPAANKMRDELAEYFKEN